MTDSAEESSSPHSTRATLPQEEITERFDTPKAVIVQAGARDRYQLSLALHEAGLLETLVTDLYCPADKAWFKRTIGVVLPRKMVNARFCPGLSGATIRLPSRALAVSSVKQVTHKAALNRDIDRALGKTARQYALRSGAALFSYSYYAHEAFKPGGELPRYRFLFQLQADAIALRRIIREELELTPAAQHSLRAEYELSLPEHLFQEHAREPELANGWVATCSFAARTLSERGIPANKIHVVPYGVDRTMFVKRPRPPIVDSAFRVVYIGSLIQRKGLSYLFEALERLKSRNVQLVLYTRGFVDQELLNRYSHLKIEVRVGLSAAVLTHEIQDADVFVLPSLAEGFGHVILEMMSCGVPVITTDHTCGPDLMADGVHGFIIPIRDADTLAARLAWGIDNRAQLAAMGDAAATQAGLFTWDCFRIGVRKAYRDMVAAV